MQTEEKPVPGGAMSKLNRRAFFGLFAGVAAALGFGRKTIAKPKAPVQFSVPLFGLPLEYHVQFSVPLFGLPLEYHAEFCERVKRKYGLKYCSSYSYPVHWPGGVQTDEYAVLFEYEGTVEETARLATRIAQYLRNDVLGKSGYDAGIVGRKPGS